MTPEEKQEQGREGSRLCFFANIWPGSSACFLFRPGYVRVHLGAFGCVLRTVSSRTGCAGSSVWVPLQISGRVPLRVSSVGGQIPGEIRLQLFLFLWVYKRFPLFRKKQGELVADGAVLVATGAAPQKKL